MIQTLFLIRQYIFDPARYLNESGDGEVVPKPNPHVLAFGSGKRQCPGEDLARSFIYMVFTGILSRFRLEKAHQNDYVNVVSTDGFTFYPKPFKFRFIPRF